MLRKKNLRENAIELVVSESKEMGYDGIVLESWSRWIAYGVLHDPDMRNKALQLVKQLGHALHSASSARNSTQKLQLVYVMVPPHPEKLQAHDFGPEDLQSLDDALLLGTNGKSVSTLSHKIFLGINFYGNDFLLFQGSGGGAIIGREYLSLLEKDMPELQWEKNSGENFFLYFDDDAKRHAVFYPSL